MSLPPDRERIDGMPEGVGFYHSAPYSLTIYNIKDAEQFQVIQAAVNAALVAGVDRVGEADQ